MPKIRILHTLLSFLSSFLFSALLLLFSPGEAEAQAQKQAADCQLAFNFTTAGQSTGALPNYTAGGVGGPNLCDTWTVAYTVTGFGGGGDSIQLTFQSAAAATPTTPGTFGTYGGTVNVGVNPNTSLSGAQSKFTNGAVSVPWVQVKLTAASGTGHVVGMLQGWNSGNGNSAGASGGAACPNPCPVVGTANAGSVPSGAPVQVGGQDGTNIRTIKTDTSGQVVNDPLGAGTAQADGATNTPTVPEANAVAATVPVYPYKFNGTTWDRDFVCPTQQAFTVSAGTDVVVVTGVASTTTRICSLSFSGDSAQTVTVRQGTGTTCLTNTATIAGPFTALAFAAWDWGSVAALRTTVQARDVCLHFGGSVTAGGVASFAAF